MPENTDSSNRGATPTFVLGAFAAFAVLLSLIQWWRGGPPPDERAALRLANTAEVTKAQDELLDRMGLKDKAKSAALYEKVAADLKKKPPVVSKMVVPGSPTQLKQAAPAPAAPAPAAPASAVPKSN